MITCKIESLNMGETPYTEESTIGSDYVHVPLPTSNELDPSTTCLPDSSKTSRELEECSAAKETNTYPASTPNWSNLSVIHKNTLPPRASFLVYPSFASAFAKTPYDTNALPLNGTWRFRLEQSPFDIDPSVLTQSPETHQVSLPSSGENWGEIMVPGHWQLQNYGSGPHYTNEIYPFPVDPPAVPYDRNETGVYVRDFLIPEAWRGEEGQNEWVEEGLQVRLRFEGVDAGFGVWINGQEVGYSQGSRNPSEWDVTKVLRKEGTNRIVVCVYRWCDGSYIEDQVSGFAYGQASLLIFPGPMVA